MYQLQDEANIADSSPSLRNVALALVVFAFGFALTDAIVNEALPSDRLSLYAEGRSEKLFAFEQARPASITVASFGTSHVNVGFIPKVFDDNFIAGQRSFNLGINGGSQTEQRAMALNFLQRSEVKPCVVILELNAGMNFTPDHLTHPRMINIYDLGAVNFVAHYSDASAGLVQRFGRFAFAALGGIENLANLGELSSYFLRGKLDEAQVDEMTLDDRRGYIEDNHKPTDRERVENIDVAAASEVNEAVPGGAVALVRELRKYSPAYTQFVYYRSPLANDLNAPKRLPKAVDVDGVSVPILNLASKDSLSLFAAPSFWADKGHLNPEGAALETKRSAQLLAASIDEKRLNACEAARAVH